MELAGYILAFKVSQKRSIIHQNTITFGPHDICLRCSNLCKKNKIQAEITDNILQITDKRFVDWIKTHLRNSGRLSKYIKEFDGRYLEKFLNAYLSFTKWTGSERLADDLQEMSIKANKELFIINCECKERDFYSYGAGYGACYMPDLRKTTFVTLEPRQGLLVRYATPNTAKFCSFI